MTTVTTERSTVEPPSLRVIVAVHGYEPPGWAQETCRLVATWAGAAVRVLAVLDVPMPPFTSLTTAARGALRRARAQWMAREQERLHAPLEALRSGLPPEAEVTRVPSGRGDMALAIAEAARAWPADIIVVGPPRPGRPSWLGPGPVHQRLVRLAGRTVMVTAPARTTAPSTLRIVERRVARHGAAAEGSA
jgi:hypothetical protein